MKKNVDRHIQTATDLKNGIICDIKVQTVPAPGMGVIEPSGSDHYGYTVGEVFENGRVFAYGRRTEDGWHEHGIGVLVTRKNANGFGQYRVGRQDRRGKWQPIPMDVTHVGCSSFHSLHLTGQFEEPETYLDPSF